MIIFTSFFITFLSTFVKFTFGKIIVGEDCSIISENVSQKDFHDSFAFTRKISEGSEGIVSLYSSKQRTACTYAVKQFKTNSPNRDQQQNERVARFRAKNEGEILQTLSDSPFFPKFYGEIEVDGEESKSFYVFMEYVGVCDLHSFLQVSNHNEYWNSIFVAQIALAIEYMHSKKIIHGDLKIENIRLCENGRIKLIDFSSAVRFQNIRHFCNGLIGTPENNAPEIEETQQFNHQIDWYSLGVIMYHLHGNWLGENEYFYKIRKDYLDNNYSVASKLIGYYTEYQRSKRVFTLRDVAKHAYFKGIDWNELKKNDGEFQVFDESDAILENFRERIQSVVRVIKEESDSLSSSET